MPFGVASCFSVRERFDNDTSCSFATRGVRQEALRDLVTERFLSYTTKVGWQAERRHWQYPTELPSDTRPLEVRKCDESTGGPQVGVVPIYGGISWTDNAITQIWYPSIAYHDAHGIVCCYNYTTDAERFGKMCITDRLDTAKKGAKVFGEAFGAGLKHGVSVAWQNMPYIKSGWPQWQHVCETNADEAMTHFNTLQQGAVMENGSVPMLFIIGDQMSSLPGWQEGAVAAALNAVHRIARPDARLPFVKNLPDSRILVENLRG